MSHKNVPRSHDVFVAHLHRVRDLLIVIVIDFLKEVFTELGGGQKEHIREERESDRYRAQITLPLPDVLDGALMS